MSNKPKPKALHDPVSRDTWVIVINETIRPYILKEDAKLPDKLTTYTFDEVMDAIAIGVKSYLKYDADGKLTSVSVDEFLKKLVGILFNKKKKAEDPELLELIQHISQNMSAKQAWMKSKVCNEITTMRRGGVTIQELYACAIGVESWEQMLRKINNFAADKALAGN